MKKFSGFSKKKKIIIIAGIALIIAFVLIPKIMPKGTDPGLFVEAKASYRDIDTYYSYEGVIEAAESQVIYASSVNEVEEFYVTEGDSVKEGQLLFKLNNDIAPNNVASAQASLSSAKLKVDEASLNATRIAELYTNGAVSKQQYESAANALSEARFHLAQAESNYKTAQDQNNEVNETAKIDGEVIGIYVDEYESVNIGSTIMEIVNYEVLEVNIKVDEYDVGYIKEGAPVEIGLNANGDTVAGKVTKISKKADVVNGVSYFPTEITFDKPDELRVGMSVEVKILAESKQNVLTVPSESIQFDDSSKPYVQVKDQNGDLNIQYVKLGINNGQFVEINDGVKENDKVVIVQKQESTSLAPGM